MSELISGKVGELLTQIQRGERITAEHIVALLNDPDCVFLTPPQHGTLRFLWNEIRGCKLLSVVDGTPVFLNSVGPDVYVTYGSQTGPRLERIVGKVSIVDGSPFYAGFIRGDSDDASFFHGSRQLMSVPYSHVCGIQLVDGKPLYVRIGAGRKAAAVMHGTTCINGKYYKGALSPQCVNGKYAFIVDEASGQHVIFEDVPGMMYGSVWGLSIVDDKPLYAASLGEMHHVVHGEVEIRVRNKVIGDPLCVDSCYWYTRERYGKQQFINQWCGPFFDKVVYATVVNGIPLHAGRNGREFIVVHGSKNYQLPGVWTAVHEVLLDDKGVKVIAQLGRSFYELVLWDE